METSCHLDGRLFPFDSQHCKVVVECWAYSEAFVDLRNHSDYVHLDGYNDDSELNMPFAYLILCIFTSAEGGNVLVRTFVCLSVYLQTTY